MLKMITQAKTETKINIFLVIFFAVGALGLGLGATRDFFIGLMPFSILLGIVLMFWMHNSWQIKQVLVFLLIALLGFFFELAGVLTGEIFGNYSYGRALGFKLWGTPPMIGLNWLMLVYAIFAIVSRYRIHRVIQVFVGALLMVGYDVVMEPVAMQLDMWDWRGGIIPMQNYIAWFLISLLMFSILHLAKLKYTNKVASTLFFVQLGFFLILNVVFS